MVHVIMTSGTEKSFSALVLGCSHYTRYNITMYRGSYTKQSWLFFSTRVSPWQNQQEDVFVQQRLRSASSSVQTDHSHLWLQWGTKGSYCKPANFPACIFCIMPMKGRKGYTCRSTKGIKAECFHPPYIWPADGRESTSLLLPVYPSEMQSLNCFRKPIKIVDRRTGV